MCPTRSTRRFSSPFLASFESRLQVNYRFPSSLPGAPSPFFNNSFNSIFMWSSLYEAAILFAQFTARFWRSIVFQFSTSPPLCARRSPVCVCALIHKNDSSLLLRCVSPRTHVGINIAASRSSFALRTKVFFFRLAFLFPSWARQE
jgi:hypothetical protein